MSKTNGNTINEEDFQRATAAIEDAVTFPLPTAVSHSGGSAGGGGGGGSGGHIGSIADRAFREAIGWRYRRGDHRGFVAAITKAFGRTEKNGRVEMQWRPQSYSVAADLGELTGALASLHQQATMVIERALPLLDALTPLTPVADLEDVATIRLLIRGELNELLGEFGRPGGPRVQRVNDYFEQLLGENPDADATLMGGQMQTLRNRFGLDNTRINGPEEERNFTNYLIFADQIFSLARMWEDKIDQFGSGGGQFLGVQLASLSQLLAVIGESVQEAYSVLDSVFISQAEREVYRLNFANGSASMTIGELFSWVESFAHTEGPRLLADGGKDGVEVFFKTITRIEGLISGIEPDTGGFSRSRVKRALRELSLHLNDAKDRSSKVRRKNMRFVEEPADLPVEPLIKVMRVDSYTPKKATQGDTKTMELEGSNFICIPSFDFGPGITASIVNNDALDVEMVSRKWTLSIQLVIDPDAKPTGLREVTVKFGDRRSRLAEGFTVLKVNSSGDDDDAPDDDGPDDGKPKVDSYDPPSLPIGGKNIDFTVHGENLDNVEHINFYGMKSEVLLKKDSTSTQLKFKVAVKPEAKPDDEVTVSLSAGKKSYPRGTIKLTKANPNT